MRDSIQIVFVLDVDKAVAVADVVELLPVGRTTRHILRLSEFEPPLVRRFQPEKSPIDWTGLAEAVARMVGRARALVPDAEAAVEHYIAGYAPLPTFAHLAAELSAWARSVTILNPRKDGTWAVVPLAGVVTHEREPFFDIAPTVPAGTPSETDGRVAVFVSCGLLPVRDAMRAFLRDHGERLGHVVEVRTSTLRDLDGADGAAAAQQIANVFSMLRGAHPHASGFAVFVAGPAQLAAMVGRAINPTILADVWFGNLDVDAYEFAFALPWQGHRQLAVSPGADDRLARRDVLDAINAGLVDFRKQFDEADLPPESFPMTRDDRLRFVDLVRELKPLREREHDSEPFRLDVLRDELLVSPGLLEALRPLGERARVDVGQQFVLHELFHISQHVRSTDYHGIGRAGVALEEVDYWADAFALGVLGAARVRDAGARGRREVARILSEITGASLQGLMAFDRLEHHERIASLQERRLRRYLVWHLQHARAATLTAAEDIWALFGARLVVELAPLEGGLDPRFDKVVRRPLADRTELFVVLNARLMREARTPSFSPAELVDAVRAYDVEGVQARLAVVLAKHADVLAPWKVRRGMGSPHGREA